MDKIKTYKEKYTENLKPWLYGDFEVIDASGAGRPRIIESPKIMAEIALEYFVQRETSGQPLTYIGLILQLGLSSRNSLDRYKGYSKDFKELIDVIKLIIEEFIVSELYTNNFRASQFLLKTNYKYSEEIHQIIENKEYRININKPKEE